MFYFSYLSLTFEERQDSVKKGSKILTFFHTTLSAKNVSRKCSYKIYNTRDKVTAFIAMKNALNHNSRATKLKRGKKSRSFDIMSKCINGEHSKRPQEFLKQLCRKKK